MPSVFTEKLYSENELTYLNQAVEEGQLEMLTTLVGIHGEMTPDKEKDINRVISLLRPRVQPVHYKQLLKQATETPRKIGRPKKEVEDLTTLASASV